jgi:predicted enzyme related to lactoylglutathione lyase
MDPNAGTPPVHSQAEPAQLGEHGGYPIYAMPAFVSLASTDPVAMVGFFTQALDFGVMFSGPEVNGTPMLVHLRRSRYQDVLVRPGPAGTPATSLVVTFAATDATEVDGLEARVRAAGGTVVCPAADTPSNTRELTVAAPEGNRYTVTARPAGGAPPDLDATMRRVAGAGAGGA